MADAQPNGHTRHDPDVKAKALEIVRRTGNCSEAARELNVPNNTVSHWAREAKLPLVQSNRSPIPDDIREQILMSIAGGVPVTELAKEHNIHVATIYGWSQAARNGGITPPRNTPLGRPRKPPVPGKHHSPETKAEALEMLAEGHSRRAIMARLGIRGHGQIDKWAADAKRKQRAPHVASVTSPAEAMLAARGKVAETAAPPGDELMRLRIEVRVLRAERDALRAAIDDIYKTPRG